MSWCVAKILNSFSFIRKRTGRGGPGGLGVGRRTVARGTLRAERFSEVLTFRLLMSTIVDVPHR